MGARHVGMLTWVYEQLQHWGGLVVLNRLLHMCEKQGQELLEGAAMGCVVLLGPVSSQGVGSQAMPFWASW